ncbi:MAG: DUF1700 domain-containing protein [Firmicutes bacterium]|nr:DUF1700 domain-containing protein [Bacillota bacterium]
MTKQEFLMQLQRSLNGSIGSRKAQNHVAYYQEYIEIEVRKGRSEEAVTEEIGDPRLIAKSISGALEHKGRNHIKEKCALFGADLINKVKRWFDSL